MTNTTASVVSEATARPWTLLADTSIIVAEIPDGENQTTGVAYCGDELRHTGGLRYGKERDANAALIVKAVNSHEALVKALEEMLDHYGGLEVSPVVKRARAALAGAK